MTIIVAFSTSAYASRWPARRSKEIQLNAAGELIFTLMVASIALVPWAKYILTKQLHLEHERKEMVFKKKELGSDVSVCWACSRSR